MNVTTATASSNDDGRCGGWSTRVGHRLRGSRSIRKTAENGGAVAPDGLVNRRPSKWSLRAGVITCHVVVRRDAGCDSTNRRALKPPASAKTADTQATRPMAV